MSTASLSLRLLQAIGLLLVGTLVACSEPTASQSEEAVSAASQQTETQRLNTWLDEQYAEQLETRPMTKTSLGDKTDYGQLDDFSLAAEQRDLEWLRESVATMLSEFDYAQLTDDGKLSYDMWKFSLERAEAGVPYRQHGYIFGRGGPHAYLPNFLINFHRVDTIADLDAYVSRLRELDRVFAELLERSQAASAAGIRQPRFGYDFALAEIERVTAGAPFSNSDSSPNSPLWTDLQSKTTALIDEGLLSAEEAQVYFQQIQELLAGEVKTAYEEVAAWLREDRELASEEAQGVWALPDGEAFYNYRLAQMTTVELTAEEIHQIGLDEVARIQAEMEAIKQQVGFDGSLQEFFTFMREDEQFYFPNTDEGRQAYLDLNNKYLDAIALKLPDYFGRLPKAALEVRRVEAFREQAGAAQHYSAGTPDGSRPGVFYSHMSDMSTLPIFQLEDVAYHEGSPGHHMQISIQQELEDVPRFRTQYRTTAYTEGWGLYSEWLAKEMGGFEDPYSDFGRLGGEIWRAIRLVVDTGIHSKRWTEEEAVQYFLANSPQAEGAVRSEIKRYIATPGQATAYKIGMLKIQEVRRNAEQALGEAFDIREFHDIVLGAGALPLPLLEARVNRWISESL
ncbi:MAG: DUF885 domain-containing protein [Proteobacteria bacterium]|nr:DUF885 domain-containing protein [Pseudomonadota bacterium]MDA0896483.1 DUF885 domain-containing protein [Pseudomonadota bacterium]MDA1243924.1 DUF885 domain-containing protein [Pseudomonadota bacterium]